MDGIMDKKIEELGLPTMAFNCLNRACITTVGELISKSPEEIRKLRNVGQGTFDVIVQKLKEYELALGDNNAKSLTPDEQDPIIKSLVAEQGERLKRISQKRALFFRYKELLQEIQKMEIQEASYDQEIADLREKLKNYLVTDEKKETQTR